MIPSTIGFMGQDFEIEEQASNVYKMDLEGNSVKGFCDGLEAVKQAVFRILNTERYQFIIYPWYYGIETIDLYGEPVTYVCPELERRIIDALSIDSRITNVADFEHDLSIKGVIHSTFRVHTIYGEFSAEREVNI